MQKLPTSIAVILALSLAGAAAAAPPPKAPPPGPTQITACQDITAPGPYVFVNNLTVTDGDCLRVTADFVEIDMAGFSISMEGTPSVLRAGIRNVDSGSGFPDGLTVRNGAISGFSSGVRIEGGIGHRIEGVRVSGNTIEGIGIVGPFNETGSDVANVVRNNVAVGNGTGAGGVGGIVVRCPALVAGNLAIDNGSLSSDFESQYVAQQFIVDGCFSNVSFSFKRSFFCTFADNAPAIKVQDLPACTVIP